jgi:hypothetical protein
MVKLIVKKTAADKIIARCDVLTDVLTEILRFSGMLRRNDW